jgi:hypothetical protein
VIPGEVDALPAERDHREDVVERPLETGGALREDLEGGELGADLVHQGRPSRCRCHAGLRHTAVAVESQPIEKGAGCLV